MILPAVVRTPTSLVFAGHNIAEVEHLGRLGTFAFAVDMIGFPAASANVVEGLAQFLDPVWSFGNRHESLAGGLGPPLPVWEGHRQGYWDAWAGFPLPEGLQLNLCLDHCIGMTHFFLVFPDQLHPFLPEIAVCFDQELEHIRI